MSAYHSFVRANQEAELRRHEVAHRRKQKQLEAQLAAGLISQQEYKHATIANENELAMKQYQLELDAAKREKAMKIADTVANTAMAIMRCQYHPPLSAYFVFAQSGFCGRGLFRHISL